MKLFYRMFVLGLLVVMFGGFGYAFYLGGAFERVWQPLSEPTDIVQQFNPDVTQIPETSAPVTPDTRPNAAIFQDLLADVNGLRDDLGFAPVTIDARLNAAAAQQAAYNASIFEPTHQDANGQNVDARVISEGYLWGHVGENLLSNWSLNGHRVFGLWEASPAHYDVMVNPNFTEIGMAYVVTEIGQVYHAMVLATPR